MTPTPRAEDLELMLFAKEPKLVSRARNAGLRSMIVDLEWRGKAMRQRDLDTEINHDRPEDLETLCNLGVPLRTCRLNRFGTWTTGEVEAALAAGANRLFLPMAETVQEVETTLATVGGRCELGILVETQRAVRAADELASLPLSCVYVGLNDLAISRSREGVVGSIFDALADGTVESLRKIFCDIPFGFGGVTVVDGGDPVPCRLLLAEMARLRCGFSFLRRSFRRDVKGRDMAVEVESIRALWSKLVCRSQIEIASDHTELLRRLAVSGTPSDAGASP
ncbi:MAG: hypothetical protein MPN21_08905 [Thermoanaerobaculia bacterium]|nr:hypothetical protein [Thermoanaerobaculia bacterium]